MAIPTGYTYETFAQWLTEEIFFEDTEGLGLDDLRGAAPASSKELILTGEGYERSTPSELLESPFVPELWTGPFSFKEYRFYTNPIPFLFEQDDEIVLENGIVLAVDVPNVLGDTHLDARVITLPVGTTIHKGLKYSKQTGQAVSAIPNPVFQAILGQVLGNMGLDEISDINSENIYEFRQRAILETLKTVMQNNVAFYPLMVVEDNSAFYGGTLAAQLLELYRVEEQNLNAYLDFLARQGNPAFNIIQEGLSSETGVKVVW